MPAFTRQFSASVGWRSQAAMNMSLISESRGQLFHVIADLKVDRNVRHRISAGRDCGVKFR